MSFTFRIKNNETNCLKHATNIIVLPARITNRLTMKIMVFVEEQKQIANARKRLALPSSSALTQIRILSVRRISFITLKKKIKNCVKFRHRILNWFQVKINSVRYRAFILLNPMW